MRARAVIAAAAASLAVMGIGVELGLARIDAAQNLAGSNGAATAAAPSGAGAAATPSPTASPDAGAAAAPVTGTFAGSVVQTRFGNMQVSVTMSAGAITDVTALQLTDHDGRSVQISNYAAPILRSEVLSAQSANVQSVSGATYTSSGYLQSLQSALDAAGV